MSSTNFRAFRADTITGSITLGPNTQYSRVWGIMRGEGNPTGSLTLEGGGVINFVSIDNHQIFPCYPKSITMVTGSIILLS
jgi:hypothetical protein